jgi:hypothetical protein
MLFQASCGDKFFLFQTFSVVYVINDIPACILFYVTLAEQIQLISINASTKILCSGVLSIIGLIREQE